MLNEPPHGPKTLYQHFALSGFMLGHVQPRPWDLAAKVRGLREACQNHKISIKAGTWLGISPTAPMAKKSRLVLGPGWPKTPQVMGPIETYNFQEGLGTWPETSPTAPLGKILGMFWGLAGQSHLR